jgi:membrane protease YdiL (CAAX protease family)
MNDSSSEPLSPPGLPPDIAPEPASELPSAQTREIRADLRTPWDALDLVIFLAFAVGVLVLLTNVLAVFVVTFYGVDPRHIESYAATNAPFIVIRQVFWFATLLLFLYAVVRRRTDQPVWRTLGWRRLDAPALNPLAAGALFLVSGATLAILIQVLSRFVATDVKVPIEALFTERRSALWMMGFGILVAPLAEETVFRGYIYPVIARRLGVVAGVVLTGMFFGLVHALQLWGAWGQIGLLMLVGTIFTGIRAWTGSVVSSYLLHLGYNSLLFAGFFFATGGLRHIPGGH